MRTGVAQCTDHDFTQPPLPLPLTKAAQSLQQSYAEGARLRAAEEAERHRLQLELAEVRPEAEGLEEGRT